MLLALERRVVPALRASLEGIFNFSPTVNFVLLRLLASRSATVVTLNFLAMYFSVSPFVTV